MRPSDLGRVIESEAKTLGVLLEPAALDALAAHLRLLFAWNKRYNLTAIVAPREAARRHVVESLEALPFLDARAGDLLCDLGSGNGYPALPLVLAVPSLRAVLVEAREARAAFLRAVVRECGLGERVRVEQARLAGADALPPETTLVTFRGLPDPAAWAGGAAARAGVRRVVAWLARADAEALAARLAGARTIPLRAHPAAALLIVERA